MSLYCEEKCWVCLVGRFTGGRPMKKTDEEGFWDTVAKRKVNIYRDLFGREWMAFGPWSIFRVSTKSPKSPSIKEEV